MFQKRPPESTRCKARHLYPASKGTLQAPWDLIKDMLTYMIKLSFTTYDDDKT